MSIKKVSVVTPAAMLYVGPVSNSSETSAISLQHYVCQAINVLKLKTCILFEYLHFCCMLMLSNDLQRFECVYMKSLVYWIVLMYTHNRSVFANHVVYYVRWCGLFRRIHGQLNMFRGEHEWGGWLIHSCQQMRVDEQQSRRVWRPPAQLYQQLVDTLRQIVVDWTRQALVDLVEYACERFTAMQFQPSLIRCLFPQRLVWDGVAYGLFIIKVIWEWDTQNEPLSSFTPKLILRFIVKLYSALTCFKVPCFPEVASYHLKQQIISVLAVSFICVFAIGFESVLSFTRDVLVHRWWFGTVQQVSAYISVFA